MIAVRVNGEDKQIREGMVVSELLVLLGTLHDGIAVAIDGKVVPKTQHATTPIGPGASIEVIRAVGGG